MEREMLNVQMFSTKDCQEIIEEIKNEYSKGGNFYERLRNIFDQFDFISHSLKPNNSLHLVQKGTRFGLFYGFNISIFWPIKYLQIMFQGDGGWLMALDENQKWGIPQKISPWDKKNEILPFEFEDINARTNDFYPVKKFGKWGVYHAGKKDMIIDPQYDNARSIKEGLWAVSKDEKWGFVDIFNNIVIPFEYKYVSNFSYGYAQAVKMDNDEIILLDHNGKETIFKNKKLFDAHYRSKINIKKSYVDHVEYYNVLGPDNETLTPLNKYRYLGEYSEGLFAASFDGKTYGYIDINENIVIPFMYQLKWGDWHLRNVFQQGIICVRLNNDKYSDEWIIINHGNEKILPYTLYNSCIEYNEKWIFHSPMSTSMGYRFKRMYISLYDLINYKRGKDMSYLIRTDKETEKEKRESIESYKKQISSLPDPYEWTAKDTWDAMTDGMYGNYSDDIDYEVLGF